MSIAEKENSAEKIDLNLTAMIDIVFLLLIFFIMTFQIIPPEGDFYVKMPRASEDKSDENRPDDRLFDTPLEIRFTADAIGDLQKIALGKKTFTSLALLNEFVRQHAALHQTGDAESKSPQIRLVLDQNLNYRHAIDAITAVSGYIDSQGERVLLSSKIDIRPWNP